MDDIIMGTHVFNEQKKRLDPVDNKCTCCGKGFSIGEKSNFYIPVFKETDRTNLVVYRNVKFSRIDIGVSRCSAGKALHKKIKPRSFLIGLLVGLGIAGAMIGMGFLLTRLTDHIVFAIVLSLVGVGLGAWLGCLFYHRTMNKMCINHDILSE